MRCKYCGKKNAACAVYCANCGRKLRRRQEPTFYRVFAILSAISFALALAAGACLTVLLAAAAANAPDTEAAAASEEPESVGAAFAVSDDTLPVDALIGFINEGGSERLRAALTEESAEELLTKAAGYGLRLPEGLLSEIARRGAIKKITAEYGDFESLRYEALSRRELTGGELAELCARFPGLMESARELTIRVTLEPSGKAFEQKLVLLLIGESWRILPDGLF